MLITQRQAAAVLAEVGVANRQAHDVLRAGLAGAPIRTGTVCLYERGAVDDLATWPLLPLAGLDDRCPRGVFVARRAPDLAAERATRLTALSSGWTMSPWTWLWLTIAIEEGGSLPCIATVAGFVALGADITAAQRTAHGTTDLTLAEPGAWFVGVRRHRVVTGPGREWVMRGVVGT